MLLNPENKSGDIINYTQEIKKFSEITAKLTKEILLFSWRTNINRSHLNINQVIESSKNLINNSSEKQIQVKFDLNKKLSSIEADKNQIEQILLNLVLYTRDSMPNGGNSYKK